MFEIMPFDRRSYRMSYNPFRELEQMGIIVDVNIDAFDLSVSGKKSLNRVGKYAAVTFARNLFSTRQMIAKRALDIVGSMVGMIILGIATIFVAPAIKLDSRCSLDRPVSERMDVSLRFISSALCIKMRRRERKS